MRKRDPKISRIAELPLFADLPQRALAAIAARADEFERPAGVTIAREGARGWEAFIVLEGNVAVWRDRSVVAVLGPGAIVGEMSLLEGARRNASVVALTATRLLALTPRDLAGIMEASPQLAARIRTRSAQRGADLPVPA